MNPLFVKFPKLKNTLPHQILGVFPTPIQKLDNLEKQLHSKNQLWIKREDLSGETYGGNKVRKLEFLLAKAKARGAKSVISLGAIGSNHVLATTLYCKQLDLNNIAILVNQPGNLKVATNLLTNISQGLNYYFARPIILFPFLFIFAYLKAWIADSIRPELIWFGGSSPTGTLGAVSLALEIAEQIKNNDLPKPDTIFVATGSNGTLAGLRVGLDLEFPEIKIQGVSVYSSNKKSIKSVTNLANKANRLLPKEYYKNYSPNDFSIDFNFIGKGYGHETASASKAIDILQKNESIKLDPTYTGKSFAAFLEFDSLNENKNILYLNSYNSKNLSKQINTELKIKLPGFLQKYI